ncbi:MAG: ABC transporter substrate-binding protein [Oleispira sp.]|nr:ABC transporter substrate-binding protein [Oleispira sp.]MBL4880728.1 ABC transporter substrate-binding protein [Oleispira sp.]
MKRLAITISLVLAFFTGTASATGPTETVKYATSSIINELSQLEGEQRSQHEIQRLVETYILPAIDQEKIAKLALGKHWKKATAEQRAAFIDTFRDLQIRTYTGAFTAFNGQEFNFKKPRFNKTGSKAIVKGEMVQPNGQKIPVDFKLYVNKQQQWKIYDAVIAGLGMVKTYRQQLNQQLRNNSLDDIINSMRTDLQTAQR